MEQYQLVNQYLKTRTKAYGSLFPEHVKHSMISERNWLERAKCKSSEDLGIVIRPGDICYLDYGQAYLFEMGFQHLGLVLAIVEKKALVIPMTSNEKTYANAYDPVTNPNGKKNLFDLGDVEKLHKRSVLFLNDMKFINTARVIEVISHLDINSSKFRRIQMSVMSLIFDAKQEKNRS